MSKKKTTMCGEHNGTYVCHLEPGHDGRHTGSVSGRVYEFVGRFSTVWWPKREFYR